MKASWIGYSKRPAMNWKAPVLPAPYFRKTFNLDQNIPDAKIKICGLGYYELYINGQKVEDRVLDPVVTVYDKRVRYVSYDVSSYLKAGQNVIGVILGNGWYNCHSTGTWHTDRAAWRDYPKLFLELSTANENILCSNTSWKVTTGPILFDGLRSGETYDARLEQADWSNIGHDDSQWNFASRVNPPGGIIEEQTMEPCRVTKTMAYQKKWNLNDKVQIYDIGQNMTGWCRIKVLGNAGAEITIEYSESLKEKDIDTTAICKFVDNAPFQTDKYILKGDSYEEWEPRFSYHGFRYVRVTVAGEAIVTKLEGRVVNTDFELIGSFESSDANLNKLQECTMWSFIGNFTGIPTDCPHREKNGWTGDAQIAAETGLFNYDAAIAYEHWLDSLADLQRPSGQLPGIAPSAGWGYNWGSGPAWDSAFILIPWYIYLYTGRTEIIYKYYDAMKKYIDYCTGMADDNIVDFGLGDWCHVDNERIAPVALTSTAYYYIDALLLSRFAMMTGHKTDQTTYAELAAKIKNSFNSKFYRGNGVYANGEQTALSCALYQGLVEESEKSAVVARLVEAVENNDNRPDFGILGSKYVPRALAENGHIELAYKLITQQKFPGWMHWLKQGATTLWEDWYGTSSQNHIMFGDISAWFYQYLGGIIPNAENPGFKHLTIKPNTVEGLEWINTSYKTPFGTVVSNWHKKGNHTYFEIEIPIGINATLTLPNSSSKNINSGKHKFKIATNIK